MSERHPFPTSGTTSLSTRKQHLFTASSSFFYSKIFFRCRFFSFRNKYKWQGDYWSVWVCQSTERYYLAQVRPVYSRYVDPEKKPLRLIFSWPFFLSKKAFPWLILSYSRTFLVSIYLLLIRTDIAYKGWRIQTKDLCPYHYCIPPQAGISGGHILIAVNRTWAVLHPIFLSVHPLQRGRHALVRRHVVLHSFGSTTGHRTGCAVFQKGYGQQFGLAWLFRPTFLGDNVQVMVAVDSRKSASTNNNDNLRQPNRSTELDGFVPFTIEATKNRKTGLAKKPFDIE